MKKAYILEGDPKEVEKVIRENRIRISRGVIKFTSVEPEAEAEQPSSSLDDADQGNNSGENIPVNGNIDGDIIPEQPEDAVNENVTENPEQMDDKTPEVDDLKEVDLDDDKTPEVDDSKDVPAADVKEAEATAKTKRTKK